ncbi:MAG: hypothetical protein ACP5SD_02280 [Elusimicrobiales bacterium]|nr:hypothetical protein [Elusimicrobiales bacterium]HOJ86999.1 hypothetical protein [Elusimicrobiales bacterium]HOL62130.1 hypothetical protein [Elusimicrobiales bacterium]HPO94717.1 hypothetical protein [Elusimicrobiales bacterium]
MEKVYSELKDFFGSKYSFISSLGYFIGALNFYVSLLLTYKYEFSLMIFILIASVFFVFNFVFSAITSLYIDIQTEQHIRAKELFYFYGMTEYLTLLFIPLYYFASAGLLKSAFLKGLFLVFLAIWIFRIWLVKKKTGLGFINSLIAIFFPHILIITVGVVFVVAVSVMAFVKIYA